MLEAYGDSQLRDLIGRAILDVLSATLTSKMPNGRVARRSPTMTVGIWLAEFFWDSVERTDEILRPRGETLPERGVSDGRPHLLEDD